MRLATFDTAIVRLPLDKPVRTAVHNITAVDCVLVTIGTDEQVSGVGYLWCFGAERALVLEAVVKDMFAQARGRNADERADIIRHLWAEANFLGMTGAVVFGISAIDMALWDICGKKQAKPLYALLGASPKPVDIYIGGLWLTDPVDDIVAEAKGYLARGFKTIKMRVGSPRWQDDVERVEAVRAAIGPDTGLMVDATQSWATDQAFKVARELERFRLEWIEEPVAFHNHADMAALASQLDTPIAAGENDYGMVGFRRLMDARAVDIAMPDLQRVGGITEWLKVATLAESIGMRVAPHVFPEICVHLLSAIPNGFHPEYADWWDPLFVTPLQISGGVIRPSAEPGLGITFDWNGLERFRVA